MNTIHSIPRSPSRWRDEVQQLGFAYEESNHLWRSNGTSFESDGRWSALRTNHDGPEYDPLTAPLGQPGLWKTLPANGSAAQRVFDLPPVALADADDDDVLSEVASEPPLKACLAWGMATAHGRLPEGWQAPSRAEVEAWIPDGGLTVQFRQIVRQGTLHHSQQRIAIRFPLVPRVPENMSEARRAMLRAVLCDGQSRVRMARIGVGPGGAIEAEVDLSGAPRGVLEGVVGSGLASLRWLVEWLEIADFIASDAASACRAFEVCAVRA
jgi:hypothetical protein